MQKSKAKTQKYNSKVKNLLVFTFALLLFTFPRLTHGALLYSQSAKQMVGLDQTFIIEWFLDTQDQVINAIDMVVEFSPETLEAMEATAGSSGINLWVETPTVDNDKGTISLVGGVAGGTNTSKFPLFRTTFRGRQLGAAKIKLADESRILLNDGAGTEMKLSFQPLTFPVVPTDVANLVNSPTHPDENIWYQNNSVEIEVAPREGEIYSYSFSSNVEMIPDELADDVSAKLTFQNLPDGIYYFKLNSKTGSGFWEEAVVRGFQIDQSPPQSFTPVVASDPAVLDGQAFISFATTDKVSGVKKYQVKVGVLGAWVETDQTFYVLPKLRLSDRVIVKAVDAAGNEQISQTEIEESRFGANFSKWLVWLIMIVGVAGLILLARKFVKRLKKI